MIYTNSTTNYTNIDTKKSVRCAEDRNPPQNASDVYEILVICRASQALYTPQRCELMRKNKQNKKQQKKKKKKKNTKKKRKKKETELFLGYSLFADHRSVPSFGPGFFCLNSVHKFRDNTVTGDIALISLVLKSMVPP